MRIGQVANLPHICDVTNYLLVFLVGFLLSLALTPLVRRLALRLKAVDMPGDRKVHAAPVPRLGGLAIIVSFQAGLLLGFGPLPELVYYLGDFAVTWLARLLPAVLVIVIVGVLDDIRPLRPMTKLLAQVLAALLAVRVGVVIGMFESPWGTTVHLGVWAIPISVLWMLALTNAFNLIDGLDGLSCGVGAISTLTLGAVALLRGDSGLVLVCALLAGSMIGFLRHNFHPARIFMGDTGSQFIGFTLAVLSITAAHKSTASLSVLVPFLAFGLPLMDTLLTTLRRALKGVQVFEADGDHIHHRLLRFGLSHRQAVLMLYGVSLLAAAATLFVVARRDLPLGLVFIGVGVATIYAVRWLRYRELEPLRSGALLALTRQPVLGYGFFQVPIDLALLAGASYLAWIAIHGVYLSPEMKEGLRDILPVAVLIKLLVLRLSGLYQVRWQYAGMADLLGGVRAILFGCAASAVALVLLKAQGGSVAVLLLDFFFTVTLLLGMRMSLRLLEHYAQTDTTDKERVLIYGTGYCADMLVHHLLNGGTMAPVGFIHDGSEQRGKTIHGIPILGTLEMLPAAARNQKAVKILISEQHLPPEQLEIIRAQCRKAGLELEQFRLELERMP
ncbi:MAG: hypothetical protein FJ395_13415 [Verrucomicrobia bacterium]|nr:hypothetical protein [Verrucomicrobiota bacterium]